MLSSDSYPLLLPRLSIAGQPVHPQEAPSDVPLASWHTEIDPEPGDYTNFEEEIFAQDGKLEDIIAVDYKST